MCIDLAKLSNDQLCQLFYMTIDENALDEIGHEVALRLSDNRMIHNTKGIPSDWDIFVGEAGLYD